MYHQEVGGGGSTGLGLHFTAWPNRALVDQPNGTMMGRSPIVTHPTRRTTAGPRQVIVSYYTHDFFRTTRYEERASEKRSCRGPMGR